MNICIDKNRNLYENLNKRLIDTSRYSASSCAETSNVDILSFQQNVYHYYINTPEVIPLNKLNILYLTNMKRNFNEHNLMISNKYVRVLNIALHMLLNKIVSLVNDNFFFFINLQTTQKYIVYKNRIVKIRIKRNKDYMRNEI